MQTSEITSSETTGNNSAEIIALLGQIMAMNDQKRLQLCKAWAAIDGSIFYDEGYDQRINVVADPANAEPSLKDEEANVLEWIASLQTLPEKQRAMKLQQAIEVEDQAWAAEMLDHELSKIKRANPWLFAEIAVINYAYKHPVLLTVLLFGFGLFLYRMFLVVKGLFT
jgi:hypothetical protein